MNFDERYRRVFIMIDWDKISNTYYYYSTADSRKKTLEIINEYLNMPTKSNLNPTYKDTYKIDLTFDLDTREIFVNSNLNDPTLVKCIVRGFLDKRF